MMSPLAGPLTARAAAPSSSRPHALAASSACTARRPLQPPRGVPALPRGGFDAKSGTWANQRDGSRARFLTRAVAEEGDAADGDESDSTASGAPSSAAAATPQQLRRHRRRGGRDATGGARGGGAGGGSAFSMMAAAMGGGEEEDDDEEEEDGEGGGLGGEGAALPADVRAALAALAESDPVSLAAALADTLPDPATREYTDPADRPGAEDVLTQAMLDEDPPGHKSGYVAIVGRPNAGKSTLLNCLTGAKLAAVSPKAQTTRHRVLGIASTPGYQMVLLDTPGLLPDRGPDGGRASSSSSSSSSSPRKSGGGPTSASASTGPSAALDARMMATVKRAAADADVLLGLIDVSSPGAAGAIAEVSTRLAAAGKPAALVLNKIDRLAGGGGLESAAVKGAVAAAAAATGLPVLPICAADGRGVAEAAAWAADALPEGPSLYPRHLLSSAPARFFVAEIVREKVMALYRDEVPYAATVAVTEYAEREPPAKDYIAVTVAVERPRQRAILLGAGGAALKRLGSAARADVELFLGRPVYLELSVKVVPGWRRSAAALEAWGY